MSVSNEQELNGQFCEYLYHYFTQEPSKILHIAGPAGSGRNLLINNYIKWFLSQFKQSVYILDCDHKYSKRSFNHFPSFRNRIFLSHVPTDLHLADQLKYLASDQMDIDPHDLLILNSISNKLKQRLANSNSFTDFQIISREYVEDVFPSIFKIIREKRCNFLIVHHVSYNFEYQSNLPYFYDLMQYLPGCWLILKPENSGENQGSQQNRITMHYSWLEKNTQKNFTKEFGYQIKDNSLSITI